MANLYLNWVNNELEVMNLSHNKTRIVLKLKQEELNEFSNNLRSVFANPTSELKINLKQNVFLYFKLIESHIKSKLMIARPQLNEFVGSIHISSTVSNELMDTLSNELSPGIQFSFNSINDIYPLSNLELIFEVI